MNKVFKFSNDYKSADNKFVVAEDIDDALYKYKKWCDENYIYDPSPSKVYNAITKIEISDLDIID